MAKHAAVAKAVQKAYEHSDQEFGRWMWQHHVPLVAIKALELSKEHSANADLAVAGAWLHDLGDAFVHQFDAKHEAKTTREAKKILTAAGYTATEIQQVLEEVIAPHSCRDGLMPETLEGKILATADALAHLTSDFYLQFAWKHLPEGKTYDEFRLWATQKLDRDFRVKIHFPELQEELIGRYLSLRDVFAVGWE